METYLAFVIEKLNYSYHHYIYRIISDPGPKMSVLKLLHTISRIQNELNTVNLL